MQENQIINNIKADGYSPGDSNILSESEHAELEQIVDRLFHDSSSEKDHSSNAPVLLSLVGVDARLDFLLNKILTHKSVADTIRGILGEHYKIWEISARYSLPGDNGLGLHQDAWGQMNLAFALNDQSSKEGSTSFLKGSHLLPRWTNFISWAKPGIANLFTKPLTLTKSDFAFFINKTWHSRRKNRGTKTKKILLFGFFPIGGKYKPLYQDQFGKIDPSCKELIQRLNLNEGVVRLNPDCVQVVASDSTTSIPYSARIEKKLFFNLLTPFIYLQVFALESIFRPMRILFGIYKLILKR
ncbi:putative 2OG-Fe(II) oxygenase [Leptospira kmetyi]|uniref:Phytanoyl-CoA dioxygenase n=1 Tax=Leptospira kmetyi TaxID=408139 RepID=A0ABX4N5U5_9LEPT|nr:putative 2OG-Fe(II) oxygenase [Leptospira kmetyi]PJZ28676.1 phytanoyl-CoA dioxygenase [Leptospira kmetyi]PJZ43123.1 phytanoyl-CoA dioxygenase [Leptospira kmetyi]